MSRVHRSDIYCLSTSCPEASLPGAFTPQDILHLVVEFLVSFEAFLHEQKSAATPPDVFAQKGAGEGSPSFATVRLTRRSST
jgi:hypothetical protein